MEVDVDKLVLEVAARFKAHGMTKHLELLRADYRDRPPEAGAPGGAQKR